MVHWWRRHPAGWRRRAAINGFGAVVTAVCTGILLVTKFTAGGWVVVVAVPLFILLFTRIHAYYRTAARALGLGSNPPKPRARRSVVVVPLINVSRLTSYALSEALSISENVEAVTVVVEDGEAGVTRERELKAEWARWNPGVPLTVLHTDYASIAGPLVSFIDGLRERLNEQVVVLLPVVVPRQIRYRALHNHFDRVLTAALRGRTDVMVARVQMPLDPEDTRDQ